MARAPPPQQPAAPTAARRRQQRQPTAPRRRGRPGGAQTRETGNRADHGLFPCNLYRGHFETF